MAESLAPNQRMVPVCESILGAVGAPLHRDAAVLDFGCGLGRHVREFRAAGYDATGVDQPVEAEIDALATLPDRDVLHLTAEDGSFPFDDETFDLCFSTSVMEHVLDYDRALREIARVLRPSGVTLHVFPARWRPVEPHTYVPFGGRFRGLGWYGLWARLGVRNEFQQGQPWPEVARRNADYGRTGINYPTASEVIRHFERHFMDVRFVERAFIDATKDVSRVSRRLNGIAGLPGVIPVYRTFHTRVVLARQPRR